MICSELNPSATKSSAPGATPGPRVSRSGTRAKPSQKSSAPGCANSATTAAKTDWPNFAQRSSAQIGLSRTQSATNKLLLRQRSGPGRGAGQPPPPGPAKAPSKLCRSTSWPVWSGRHSPTRWNNSVFCRTGGSSLLRPLNSNFVQRISSGHRSYAVAALQAPQSRLNTR